MDQANLQAVHDFISPDSYFLVNKAIVHEYGFNAALLLADLVSKSKYFASKNKLDNGWFFNTEENRQKDTCLSPKQQRNAIKVLKDAGLISTERRGIPAKQWFRINADRILNRPVQQKSNNCTGKKDTTINDNKTNDNKKTSKDVYTANDKSFASDGIVNKYRRSSKPKKEIKKELHPIVKQWNEHPRVRKHKNPSSRIHKSIKEKITRLLNNTFYKTYRLDPEFLKRNNIDKDFVFDDDSISIGIDFLHEAYTDGYEPENKEWLNGMSLDDLLYNPRTRTSIFLKFMFNPPQDIDMHMPQVLSDWWDKMIDEGFFTEKELDVDNRTELVFRKALLSIEKYYDWLKTSILPDDVRAAGYLRDETSFFDFYLKWLRYRYTDYKLNVWMIGAKAREWYQFIHWLEDAIDVDNLDDRSF